MKSAIGTIAAVFLLVVAEAPAAAEDLEGTLKKIKETGIVTIGYRETSLPLSYLDDKLMPVGFSIELCKHVVGAVKAKLGMPGISPMMARMAAVMNITWDLLNSCPTS